MEEAVFHKVYKETVTGKLNSVEAALLGKQLLVKKKKKSTKKCKASYQKHPWEVCMKNMTVTCKATNVLPTLPAQPRINFTFARSKHRKDQRRVLISFERSHCTMLSQKKNP